MLCHAAGQPIELATIPPRVWRKRHRGEEGEQEEKGENERKEDGVLEQEQEAPSSVSEVNQVPHIEEEVQQEESFTIPEMSQVSQRRHSQHGDYSINIRGRITAIDSASQLTYPLDPRPGKDSTAHPPDTTGEDPAAFATLAAQLLQGPTL